MRKSYNLTGQKFGKLTAVEKEPKIKGKSTKWVCECECGNTHRVYTSHLINGLVKSCGCLRQESKIKYDFLTEYIIGTTLKGEIFIVDHEDFEIIKNYNWFTDKDGYFVASRKNKRILMSHVIMNPNKGEVIDHIDHNISNNRKNNLRICNYSQNAMNRKRPVNNTSGKKGVSFRKETGNWRAYIGVEGKNIFLGSFNSFEEAVAARIMAEEKYHGEYNYA